MNTDHWEFYVVSTKVIEEKLTDRKSMGLTTLRSLARPVKYDKLKDTVEKANN